MSSTSNKKRFAGNQGFDSLLNVKTLEDDKEASSSRVNNKIVSKKIPLIRTTYVLRKDLLEKFRAIAYWDRRLLKDVMEEAMTELIKRYESENGPIKHLPDS